MTLSRRQFVSAGAALAAAGAAAPLQAGTAAPAPGATLPPALASLSSITTGAQPIGAAERRARRDKLGALMRHSGVDAVLIEPGSSLVYFTGIEWWISERITAALIMADGGLAFITPAFEEDRLRELLDAQAGAHAKTPANVLTWEEDEDPFVLLGDWLKQPSRKIKTIALDEAVRHFIAHRLQQAAPDIRHTTAVGLVNGCRTVKSAAELALMQLAADVTVAAYRAVYPLVQAGMDNAAIAALMFQAQSRLGGDSPAGGAQVGKGSALPHGSKEPEYVAEGQVVLMDFGCSVGGYRSDISRTFVFGEPNAEQRKLWQQVRRGQDIAFATAKPGTPAREVDIAVRSYYETLGYGPDYRLPGLSHRTGHGIGLDIHEPINFVRNEDTPLVAGMCLSNEPGIYIPGKYGVRLEDCLYITDEGPRWFSTPPERIDEPMG
ncbi:M24 family metallopeptidase [Parahaliea mediterranea]|uniref:M24 family metallopeptidase n=1 Tax=Parahaliea mediterranea TaxID=651086 RepID=UPI000E2F9E86|nr:Xaa-Pro peptidase family protein [Parahaliea mediterranea]